MRQDPAMSSSTVRERHRTRVCKRCKFSTTDSLKFYQHQISAHSEHPEPSESENPEVYSCNKCDYLSFNKSEYCAHKRSHHSKRTYSESDKSGNEEEGVPSSVLSRTLSDGGEEDLVLRSGLTLPTRTYTCSDCGATTTSPRQHLHHLVQDHGYDYTIYECDLCDYATRYKQKLPRHRRCHFVSPSETHRVISPPHRRTRSHSEMDTDKMPYTDHHKDDIDSRSDDSGVKDINENVKDSLEVNGPKVNGNDKHRRHEDEEEDDDRSLIIDTRVTPSDAGPFIVEKNLGSSPPRHIPPPSSLPPSMPPIMAPRTTKKGTAPIREAVDPAKYIRVQDVDGIKYACSKCGNIYKWRKSLNKHWKEKHDGEIPTPLGPTGYAALNIPHLVQQGLPGLPFSLKGSQARLGMKGFPDLSRSMSHSLYSNSMSFDKPSAIKSTLLASPVKDTKWGMEGFRRSPIVSTPSPKPSSMHAEKSMGLSSQGYLQNSVMSMSKSARDKPKTFTNTSPSPFLLAVPPAAHSKGMKKATEVCDEAPLDLSKPSSKKDTIIIEENSAEILNLSRSESLASGTKLKSSNNFSMDFSRKIESVMNCYLSGGAVQVKQEMPDVYSAGNYGIYQCFKCPYAAKDAADYEQHLASHASNKPVSHRCAECQETFSGLDELNEHFGSAHSDLIKSSDLPDSELLSKARENLQLYRYLTMPKDGTFRCMVCGSVFSWQWDLARHFDKVHACLPNPYQRNVEDDEERPPSPKRARLDMDMTCQLCKAFQARDREELRRHLLVHSLNKQHQCTMCGYSTEWQEDLTQHIRRYHNKSSEDENEPDETETMASLFEKKSYLSSLGLRSSDEIQDETSRSSNKRDHSSIKSVSPSPPKLTGSYSKKNRGGGNSAEILLPYKCSVCEYRARWPSEITQHMKNHSDEKPFGCPRCNYKSKWKWDVVKHLKRCGGGTVKDVIDCSKGKSSTPPWVKALQFKASTNSSLSTGPPNVTVVSPTTMPADSEALRRYYRGGEDSHSSTASPIPAQLHCLQCPFVSSSPAELKRHSRVHSDDKPFACITCNYSSKWKCDLKKHLRTYGHVAAPMDMSDRSNDEDDEEGEGSSMGSHEDERSELKCGKCSFIATTRSVLDSHMKIHSQEKSSKLRCKQCDYEAEDLPGFLQHKLVHSQEARETSMDRDDSTVTSLPETPRHRRKPQKQFCCDRCPYTTFDRANMESHQECHEATNMDFTCDYCNFSTNDQDLMDDHIKVHPEFFNDMQPQQSDENDDEDEDAANKMQDENYEKSDDENAESTPSPEDNNDADESGNEESALDDDEQRTSPQDNSPKATENGDHFLVAGSHPNSRRQGEGESFQDEDSDGKGECEEYNSEGEHMNGLSSTCPKCPFSTRSRSAMQKHTDMHSSDGKLQCDLCDYSVNRMNLLLQHKRVHSSKLLNDSHIPAHELKDCEDLDDGVNSTSYPCQFCPFITKHLKALQTHIQMHIIGQDRSSPAAFQISRPRSPEHAHEKSKFYYKCSRCPYQTNNRGNFHSHKTQHEIRSKLQCPYCDYSSARSSQISNHVKLHFPGNQLKSDMVWTLILSANQGSEISPNASASDDMDADNSIHSNESDSGISSIAMKSCRYCDQQFPDSLAKELHEKQHVADVSVY